MESSAIRSGSASLIATSVIVEDLSRNSSARQLSSASSQITAIGTTIAVAVRNVVGLERTVLQVESAASEDNDR